MLTLGYIVMTRTTVQSDELKNTFETICYQVRSPFRIIQFTGRWSYYVRKICKPDRSELKFLAVDLCPLHPSLKSCESFDRSDT